MCYSADSSHSQEHRGEPLLFSTSALGSLLHALYNVYPQNTYFTANVFTKLQEEKEVPQLPHNDSTRLRVNPFANRGRVFLCLFATAFQCTGNQHSYVVFVIFWKETAPAVRPKQISYSRNLWDDQYNRMQTVTRHGHADHVEMTTHNQNCFLEDNKSCIRVTSLRFYDCNSQDIKTISNTETL